MNTAREPDDLIIHKRQDIQSGMSLREAVARHLTAYGPAAVGPSAYDIALALCAHEQAIQQELDFLAADGKARALRPDPSGPERWELVDYSGPPWPRQSEIGLAYAGVPLEDIPDDGQRAAVARHRRENPA